MGDTTFGTELYGSVRPIPEDEGALQIVCDAIGTMANQLELLTRQDDDGNAPWSVIYDLDRAEGYMLPHLAQLVGFRIPKGTPDAAAREMIRQPPDQGRGTLAKLTRDVKATLTGGQYLRVKERDGSPYRFSVFVRSAECPDHAATLAAALATKPAGLVLNLVITDGTVIDELTGTINALSGVIDDLSH